MRLLSPVILALIALLSLPPDKAMGQRCFDDVVCVDTRKSNSTVDFSVENRLHIPVEVTLDVEVENMVASKRMPYRAIFPGREKAYAMQLSAINSGRAWRYEYKIRWRNAGGYGAEHNANHVYSLPYANGTSHLVSQGFNGRLSHQNKHAIDWQMPVGTQVHAAREGMVVLTESSYKVGGKSERFKDMANYILIQHADGSIGAYFHLKYEGVFVRPGDSINKGQLIGLSGDTGFSSGPHLHFEVYVRGERLEIQTVPITFRTNTQDKSELVKGKSYTAQ